MVTTRFDQQNLSREQLLPITIDRFQPVAAPEMELAKKVPIKRAARNLLMTASKKTRGWTKIIVLLTILFFSMIASLRAQEPSEPSPVEHLFDINRKHERYLNERYPDTKKDRITKELRDEFNKEGESLSDKARGLIVVEDSKWLILDLGHTYLVRKEKNQDPLSVYTSFIGEILEIEGTVTRNSIKVKKGIKLHAGDTLETARGSSVRYELHDKVNRRVEQKLLANSYVEVLDPEEVVLKRGGTEVDNLGQAIFTLHGPNKTNYVSRGTRFRVAIAPEETTLDVFSDWVEVKGREQGKGTNVLRDYRAIVPNQGNEEEGNITGAVEKTDKVPPLTVITPRPIGWQMLFSPVPGASRFYASGRKIALVSQVVSMASLAGAVYCEIKRRETSAASREAYDDYGPNGEEFKPDRIQRFYARHVDHVNQSNRYRARRDLLLGAYGVLFVIETSLTVREWLAYERLLEESRKPTETSQSARVGIEISDDAMVAKTCWRFE